MRQIIKNSYAYMTIENTIERTSVIWARLWSNVGRKLSNFISKLHARGILKQFNRIRKLFIGISMNFHLLLKCFFAF